MKASAVIVLLLGLLSLSCLIWLTAAVASKFCSCIMQLACGAHSVGMAKKDDMSHFCYSFVSHALTIYLLHIMRFSHVWCIF